MPLHVFLKMKRKKKSTRKTSKLDITMSDWLRSKPYGQSVDNYDRFYLNCCNEVFKILNPYKEWFDEGQLTRENRKKLACMLVSYFEDFICEIGIWKTFIDYNRELYGYYLPFYDLSEYDPEYINVEDIAYLIWHVMTKCLDTRIYAPDHAYTIELAEQIYDYLESMIEEVPGMDFYDQFFSVTSEEDFFVLKEKLFWMSTASYLMGWELGREMKEETAQLLEEKMDNPDILGPMSYAIREDYIYTKRCSFATFNAPEWFSILARCNDDSLRETIRNLSKRHQGYYICSDESEKHYNFININTEREYPVLKDSIKSPLQKEDVNNVAYVMTLIKWNDEWMLTGMMSGWEMTEQERIKAKTQPVNNFWSASEETQKRLRENTEMLYNAFIDLFGSPLALFSNRNEFEKANQDLLKHYSSKIEVKPDPHYERRRKEYLEMNNLVSESDFSKLPSSDGYGLFFIKDIGLITLSDIQDIIISLKKKSLTKEEEVELFYDLTVNTMPEVAEYLLQRFGKKNFVHPVSLSKVDPYTYRHFYWRFFHPEEYGPKYPLMSEVGI